MMYVADSAVGGALWASSALECARRRVYRAMRREK